MPTETDDGEKCLTWKIINAVAEREGVDPDELPPLYETIDMDALNTIFDPETERPFPARVDFVYNGYEVIVYSDDTVMLTPISEQSPTGPSIESPVSDNV